MLAKRKSGGALAALVCIGVGSMTSGASAVTLVQNAEVTAITASPSQRDPSDLQDDTVAEPASPDEKPGSESAASRSLDEVKKYLWRVYQRSSTKSDSHGDFTWKDAAAAHVWGLSTQDYVIGGMDPDFREQLFAAGHAMDEAGIAWTILSAFRDDFRQSLAVGFKARAGNSFHGGSTATGGYGHGCAVDLASVDGLSDDNVWSWLDAHGQQFGLHRPMRGIDPAHVQPVTGWHELATTLRKRRVGARPQSDTAGSEPAEPAPRVTDSTLDVDLTKSQTGCMRAQLVGAQNQRRENTHRLAFVAHRSAPKHGAKSEEKTVSTAAAGVKTRHVNLRHAPSDSISSRMKAKGRSHLAGREAWANQTATARNEDSAQL
jgi:hypothetical protein